ncbi:hypothetical protein ID866_7808, partial [Astraeus odoratus]
MSARRDTAVFPATSIGRSPAVNISRAGSRESLAAHPLVHADPTAEHVSHTPPSASTRYVPYTPRQRQPTTGSPVLPSVSVSPQQPQHQGGAAGKLQMMNLKAAAQGIGLDSASVGWAILERISNEGDTTEEWAEIWNAITKGKASLLLPLVPSTGQEKITAEFVQDHTIVFNTASRDDTPVVTLSGLRGQLVNDVLTLRSTLPPTTKHFQELFASPLSRATLLHALPPLPFYPPESSYPTFSVPAHTSSLPLPPRASKPPLPPRPTARPAAPQPPSRLAMPFASLFGQKPASTPSTAPAPPCAPPSSSAQLQPQSQPTSVSVSVSSSSSTADAAEPPIDISAFTIGAPISRQDVAAEIVAALTSEIAVSLGDQPPWVVERVQAFAAPLLPFVRGPHHPPGGKKKKKLQDLVGSPGAARYVINVGGVHASTPEELSGKFQEFYALVEAELRKDAQGAGRGDDLKDRRGAGHDTGGDQQESETEKHREDREADVRAVLETIEATLCDLLYDRLFLPSGSDDASHDEALSSRIAALNMLDLGLEHLDVDVGHASREDLDAVVRACGETLAQLDLASRNPRDKAIVLVSAHKIVVEGLSRIPPLRLKASNSPPPSAFPDTIEHDNALQVFVSSPSDVAPDDPQPAEEPPENSALFKRSPTPESQTPRPPSRPGVANASMPTPVSGDVLLPLLIFSVVKANPAHLVSHLLFTQRFRNQSFGGEEAYCLINLMAVAEFLENVDLGALGLKDSDRVVSTAELTPIPIARAAATTPPSPVAAAALDGASFGLRGRVEQGVDAIAGSANKVITGVFDSSFGVLRALIPGQSPAGGVVASNTVGVAGTGTGASTGERQPPPADPTAEPLPSSSLSPLSPLAAGAGAAWDTSVRLLRRESGFSIASLAASLPGAQGPRSRAGSNVDETGQRELVEVSSRPA